MKEIKTREAVLSMDERRKTHSNLISMQQTEKPKTCHSSIDCIQKPATLLKKKSEERKTGVRESPQSKNSSLRGEQENSRNIESVYKRRVNR